MNVSDVNNGSGRLVRYRRYVSPPLIALVLAILLFFSGGLINPDFVNLNQATNIVRLAAFLGIIAAGQTLVIISGGEGIDLSIGAVVTLAAMLTFRCRRAQRADRAGLPLRSARVWWSAS